MTEQLSAKTANRADYFFGMVDRIVTGYSHDLDELMKDMYSAVTQPDAISTEEAERYYAELTNMLYFMSTKLEQLNVYSDMAGISYKEAFNKAYIARSAEKDDKGKGVRTVDGNQAQSELDTQYEQVNSNVYNHAYKCLKAKCETAGEAVTMLKNLIKRRMNEEYLSNLGKNE